MLTTDFSKLCQVLPYQAPAQANAQRCVDGRSSFRSAAADFARQHLLAGPEVHNDRAPLTLRQYAVPPSLMRKDHRPYLERDAGY